MFLNAKLIPLSAPIRTLILHAVCRGYFLELTHIVTEITECGLSNRKEFLLVRSATTVATAKTSIIQYCIMYLYDYICMLQYLLLDNT